MPPLSSWLFPFKVLFGLSIIRLDLGVSQIGAGFPFFSMQARYSYCEPIKLQSTSKSCFTTQPAAAAFPNLCWFYLLSRTPSLALFKHRICHQKLAFLLSHSFCLREAIFLICVVQLILHSAPSHNKGGTINFLIGQKVKLLGCHPVRDVCAKFVFFFASLTNHSFFSWATFSNSIKRQLRWM